MPVPDELPERSPPALAFLVSGEGTILEGVAGEIARGALDARIVGVLADRPGVGALGRARRLALPAVVVPRDLGPPSAWTEAVGAALRSSAPDLIILDGFRTILPPGLVRSWWGRILNVHPSLLPRHGGRGFYGSRVHEAVLAAGDRETGVTVHQVTPAVDAGPIVLQSRIPVGPTDTAATLRERLRPLEISLLCEAIRQWTPPAPGGSRSD